MAYLNQKAMKSNGGKMPVYGTHSSSTEHFSFTDPNKVNNFELCNIYKSDTQTYSIGDLYIRRGRKVFYISSFLLIINLLLYLK